MKFTLLFLFYSILASSVSNAQTPAQTIPNFTLYKLDKSAFTNANLAANKMLFFFFFDPSCEHCQRAATNLNLQYPDYKKAAIYLVSEADTETMKMFITQYLSQLSKAQNVTVLHDAKHEFLSKFQPIRYPAMFLYSSQKKLMDYEDNAESMFRFKKPLTTFL